MYICAACSPSTRSWRRAVQRAVPMGPECVQHRAAVSRASGARLVRSTIGSANGRRTERGLRSAPAVRADRRPLSHRAHARAALRQPRVDRCARAPRVRRPGGSPVCAPAYRRTRARLPRGAARRFPADALRASRATVQSRAPVPLALPGAVHLVEAVAVSARASIA